MTGRYMAAISSQCNDCANDMESMFEFGVSYVSNLLDHKLTNLERAAIKNIAARSTDYCPHMR